MTTLARATVPDVVPDAEPAIAPTVTAGSVEPTRSPGRPGLRVAPLHRRDVGVLALAYVVLTAIYTAVGLSIKKWWEPSRAGDREADVNRWLEAHRTGSRSKLAELGSALSNTETKIVMVLLLLPLMLWMYRRWHDWALITVALLLEVAVFGTSSKLVVRDRPPVEQLDGAPTNSWPSGHMAASVVFYVGLATIICWHTRWRPSRMVFLTLAVAAPLIVGMSRLYQGMHYLTDLAGGVVLGLIALTLVRLLLTRTAARSGVQLRCAE